MVLWGGRAGVTSLPIRGTTHIPTEVPRLYLTECIHSLVSESQPPHKMVNVLFTFTNGKTELTVCGGINFLQPIDKSIVSDKTLPLQDSRPVLAERRTRLCHEASATRETVQPQAVM